MNPDVSIVVPVRNEGDNIAALVGGLTQAFNGVNMEVIYVDDSTDDTPDVIEFVAKHSLVDVRLIHREGDFRWGGLGGAVVDGFRAARGDFLIVCDGDLQHPPSTARELYERAKRGDVDMVVASRYANGGDAGGLAGGARHVVSQTSTALARAAFPRRVGKCSDPMTGFFLLRRGAIDVHTLQPNGFKILLEILARHDLRLAEVPFTFGERHAGQSKANLKEGLRFFTQLANLRFGRVSKFVAVGLSGAVLNLAIMFALVYGLGVNYLVSSVLATEVAIISNFLLQERYVFLDRRGDSRWRSRASKSFLINNAEQVIRLPFLALLVNTLGVAEVRAQALCLVVAFGARYFVLSRFLYGSKTTPTLPVPRPANNTGVTPNQSDLPVSLLDAAQPGGPTA